MSEQIDSNLYVSYPAKETGTLIPPNSSWDSTWNRWTLINHMLTIKPHLSVDNLIREADKIIKFIKKEVS